MKKAVEGLGGMILTMQGNADYEGVKQLIIPNQLFLITCRKILIN